MSSKSVARLVVCAFVGSGLVACDSTATPKSGSDAAISDGGVTDAASHDGSVDATADAGTPLPPAVTNAQGVLTPYPNLTYSTVSGYQIVSANFVIVHDGDPRGPLLHAYFEVKNTGTSVVCNFLPSFTLNGTDLLGEIQGAPYYESGQTVTSPCIPPGGTGVLVGIARGIDETGLASGDVSVDPMPLADTYSPATDGPTLVSPTVKAVATGGFGLSGSLSVGVAVQNYALRVYPRDSRGVLVDELLAFPNNLGTLTAGSSVPFATNGTSTSFTTYLAFSSWIE